jgi:hypothetical protein
MGHGGFRLPTERERTLLGDSSRILFGSGAGGSIGWADLDLRMGVLIAHNRMFAAQLDLSPEQHPFHALSEAVRAVARDHLQPVSRDPLRAATSSRAG